MQMKQQNKITLVQKETVITQTDLSAKLVKIIQALTKKYNSHLNNFSHVTYSPLKSMLSSLNLKMKHYIIQSNSFLECF